MTKHFFKCRFNAYSKLRRHFEVILENSVRSIGRNFSGDAFIHCRADCVYIRPRTLSAVAAVLLHRSVAVLQHNRKTALVCKFPCSTEIEKLYLLVHKHNIIGTDIPVYKIFFVYLFQRMKNRHQKTNSIVRRDSADLIQVVFQRYTVEIFHYDIYCAVFLEEIAHCNDSGFIGEFCKRPCLTQEVLAAFREQLLCGFGTDAHYLIGNGIVSVDHAVRKEFLYRNTELQKGIKTDIGDAEAALSYHSADKIAAVEHRAELQRMRQLAVFTYILAACGAFLLGVRHFIHTKGTIFRTDHLRVRFFQIITKRIYHSTAERKQAPFRLF